MTNPEKAVNDLNGFKRIIVSIERQVRALEMDGVKWTAFLKTFNGVTVADYYQSLVRPHLDLANMGVCIGTFGSGPISYESSLCLLANLLDRAAQLNATVLSHPMYVNIRESAWGELDDAKQNLRKGGAD